MAHVTIQFLLKIDCECVCVSICAQTYESECSYSSEEMEQFQTEVKQLQTQMKQLKVSSQSHTSLFCPAAAGHDQHTRIWGELYFVLCCLFSPH